MQIYIHRNNQQLGPFTEAEIKAQLAAGTTSTQDHVWWQGQTEWLPIAQSPLMAVLTDTTPGSTPMPLIPPPGTPGVAAVNAPPSCKLATWSLVCACLSILCGIFTSIPAIILGHMGRSEIKKNPTLQGGGMALAGLIIGYVFTALYVFIVGISVLIALGNQVKMATGAPTKSDLSTNSDSPSSSNSDSTTNAPDQSTPAPAATTASPDASTNSAPASTNSPDASTNAPAQTNSPNASTNTATPSSNTAPLSQ